MIVDSLGMFDAARALPDQIERAQQAAASIGELPDHDDIENVLVLSAGASAMAGELLPVVAGPFMPVPVVVHQGYGLPNFVDEHTLVFAVSFLGDTDETLEGAASAAAAGARLVVVTGGGELAELARQWSAPIVTVDTSLPTARAAVGAVSIPPLAVLERVGLFRGASSWIDAAVAQLRRRLAGGAADELAAAVSRRIGRQVPIVYGGGGIGGVAARRWKRQFNENAKMPAFWNQVPELCHDEISGWGQNGDVTRQLFSLVELRHGFEHARLAPRFGATRDLVDECVHQILTVEAEGGGRLAQLLDLMYFGDWASCYLALQNDVDPGPIDAIAALKSRLAGTG